MINYVLFTVYHLSAIYYCSCINSIIIIIIMINRFIVIIIAFKEPLHRCDSASPPHFPGARLHCLPSVCAPPGALRTLLQKNSLITKEKLGRSAGPQRTLGRHSSGTDVAGAPGEA